MDAALGAIKTAHGKTSIEPALLKQLETLAAAHPDDLRFSCSKTDTGYKFVCQERKCWSVVALAALPNGALGSLAPWSEHVQTLKHTSARDARLAMAASRAPSSSSKKAAAAVPRDVKPAVPIQDLKPLVPAEDVKPKMPAAVVAPAPAPVASSSAPKSTAMSRMREALADARKVKAEAAPVASGSGLAAAAAAAAPVQAMVKPTPEKIAAAVTRLAAIRQLRLSLNTAMAGLPTKGRGSRTSRNYYRTRLADLRREEITLLPTSRGEAAPAPYVPMTAQTLVAAPKPTFDFAAQAAAQQIRNGTAAGSAAVGAFIDQSSALGGGAGLYDSDSDGDDDGMAALMAGRAGGAYNPYAYEATMSTEEHQAFLQHAMDGAEFASSLTVQQARKELGMEEDAPARLEGMAPSMILMPHQLMGVSWLVKQEDGKISGGILADEMGLGKTVQAIALMLARPPDRPKEAKSTLIVAPLALLQQWKNEIEDKCMPGQFKVLIHHGNGRVAKRKDLDKYDVVLTTYSTLALDWQPDDELESKRQKRIAKKKGKNVDDWHWEPKYDHGPLVRNQWHRIILDEAQNIRNRNTRAARSVMSLNSDFRILLTGTPVVNSLIDLYSPIRFLQIKPWHEWSELIVQFNDRIGRLEKKRPQEAARRAQILLSGLLLRRKKDTMLDGKPLITLPTKNVELVELEFSEEERAVYLMVEQKAQDVFNRYRKAGTVMKNYANMLVLLTRLRQITCHPALVTEDVLEAAFMDPEDAEGQYAEETTRAKTELGLERAIKIKHDFLVRAKDRMNAEREGRPIDLHECAICLEGDFTDGVVTACAHCFCRDCIMEVIETPAAEDGGDLDGDAEADGAARPKKMRADERPCPSCRQPISADRLYDMRAFEPTDNELAARRDSARHSPMDVDDEAAVDEAIQSSSDEDEMPKKKSAASRKRKVVAVISDDEDSDLPDDAAPAAKKTAISVDSDSDSDAAPIARKKLRSAKSRRAAVVQDSEDDDEGTGDESDQAFIDDSDADERHDEYKGNTVSRGPRTTRSKTAPARKADKPKAKRAPKKPAFAIEGYEKSQFLPSTKMINMFEELERNSIEHPEEKTIIVRWRCCVPADVPRISSFVGNLELVDIYLSGKDIDLCRYQGDMNRRERDEAVEAFMRNDRVSVMLMSLKCGGVGLNLTRANRVIALDLAWSPAVENQAFDRVHRLGQAREVYIRRLVIKDTVEQRMLDLQGRKGSLADNALGEGTGKKLSRMTVAELAGLFGLDHLGRRVADQ